MSGFFAAPSNVGRTVELAEIPAATIDAIMPWRVDINPWTPRAASTGTFTTAAAACLGGGYLPSTSGAQNDYAAWDVVMAAGTWTMEIRYVRATDAGIITPSIAGANQTTYDGYAASVDYNNTYTQTGIAVATTAKKRIALTASSKNASSAAYNFYTQWISLVRTA